MKIIDKNLKGHIFHYIAQCLIATLALAVVLLSLDVFMNTAVVASIGATSFIIFTMPRTKRAGAYYVLGGYAVGTIVGVAFNQIIPMSSGLLYQLLAALAVGVSMFIMVITNTEHPPAAALALGIAVNGYSYEMLGFVYAVAVFLIGVKWLLRKWLIDLL